MVNSGGTVIDTTGPDDTSGDFAVYYGSSPPNSTPQLAFQANTGYLWTCSPSAGATSSGLGMLSGADPAVEG